MTPIGVTNNFDGWKSVEFNVGLVKVTRPFFRFQTLFSFPHYCFQWRTAFLRSRSLDTNRRSYTPRGLN